MNTLRWSEEQLAAYRGRGGAAPVALPPECRSEIPSNAARARWAGPAKGRFKSKTEARFAEQLDARRKAGEILYWRYEPISLRLVEGERVHYTPDFMVAECDGSTTLIEVKGFMREAARLRFLAARERFPQFRWRLVWARRKEFVEGRL